ncbi:hypothetical protein HZC09_02550 [Candidatus Micrarchaeota archaeon]|nr:hypothetical protein [Candidatus Micrarchaeota archaeon]
MNDYPENDEYIRFVASYEGKLKREFSLETARSVENAKKALNDIFELRKQKIVFKALRDFQRNNSSEEGLAGKEKELYTGLIRLLSTVGELTKTSASESEEARVEVLKDIPAFVGLDSQNYGPYKAGDVVGFNGKQAEFLNRKGVVKIIT